MTQVYSVPSREDDPHSLPDVEVFYLNQNDVEEFRENGNDIAGEGWYYWYCMPGCLPDGDPIGPFDSEQAAIDDAQEDAWQFEDDDDDAEADND